jgi:hypothetical protein
MKSSNVTNQMLLNKSDESDVVEYVSGQLFNTGYRMGADLLTNFLC